MPNFGDEDDDDRVCGTLRWKEVVLPASVTEADVDTLIFVELNKRWLKVARIAGSVIETCETRSIPLSTCVIAARIQRLPEVGRRQGGLSLWPSFFGARRGVVLPNVGPQTAAIESLPKTPN